MCKVDCARASPSQLACQMLVWLMPFSSRYPYQLHHDVSVFRGMFEQCLGVTDQGLKVQSARTRAFAMPPCSYLQRLGALYDLEERPLAEAQAETARVDALNQKTQGCSGGLSTGDTRRAAYGSQCFGVETKRALHAN